MMKVSNKTSEKFHSIYGIVATVLFLPLLFVFYLYSIDYFNSQNAIDVILWDNDENKKPPLYPPKYGDREYSVINIIGDIKQDNTQLGYARQEMRKIVRTKDTVRGIRFVFGNKAKYQYLIKAIDICNEEKPTIYSIEGNNIWVWMYEYPASNLQQEIRSIDI